MPSAVSISQTTVGGMTGLIAENENIRLVTLPEFGSRIVSLIYKPTETNYAWQNPRIPIRKPNFEKRFEDPVTGFFDCLPTCEGCTFKGRKLPFMGEVSSRPWNVTATEANYDFALIETERTLVTYPLHVRKEAMLRRGSAILELKYTLSNMADEVTEYHYSAHNTMTLPEGTQIILPPEVSSVWVGASFHGRAGKTGREVSWPRAKRGKGKYVDLSRIGSPCLGSGENLYTPKLSDGWCAAINKSKKEMIGFTFPTDRLPHLLIWENHGGYKGYFHTALEPCTGRPDNLAHAVNRTLDYLALKPKEMISWTERIVFAHDIDNVEKITSEGDIVTQPPKRNIS